MKKSIISLVLALVMVFSLVLVAAPQAQAATHTDHCVCGGKASGMPNHTCETATAWIELTTAVLDAGDGNAYVLPAGNYYLAKNLEIEKRINVKSGDTVTICLNGYTLSNSQQSGAMAKTDDNMRVFNLNKDNSTLNICDCSANNTGAITSDSASHGAIVFMQRRVTTTFNLYGGTLSCSQTASKTGGLIRQYVDESVDAETGALKYPNQNHVFNMYGGVIKNGKVTGEGIEGGNIAIYRTMNLYGGTIEGGEPNSIYLSATGVLNVVNTEKSTTVKAEEGATVNTTNMDSSLTYANGALTKAGDTPATGDSANLVVMGLGLVLGVAGMACLLPKKQTV